MTLENLFIEQLMSNKQLLDEGSLSHWDRQNRLYLVEVCGLQSCGVSRKVEKWSLLWKGAIGVEKRKQVGIRGGSSDFFNYPGF